ncbi:hypothetical protein J6590_034077 [Homalodisca vitripennis]|nr:hypothetical protein J6590_034077 [Homalodisca vitripennis]
MAIRASANHDRFLKFNYFSINVNFKALSPRKTGLWRGMAARGWADSANAGGEERREMTRRRCTSTGVIYSVRTSSCGLRVSLLPGVSCQTINYSRGYINPVEETPIDVFSSPCNIFIGGKMRAGVRQGSGSRTMGDKSEVDSPIVRPPPPRARLPTRPDTIQTEHSVSVDLGNPAGSGESVETIARFSRLHAPPARTFITDDCPLLTLKSSIVQGNLMFIRTEVSCMLISN